MMISPFDTIGPYAARDVAGDALADMPEDERAFLQEEADSLIAAYNRGEAMPALFASRHLDLEETLAIWFLLPSHIRRAIKNA